MPEDQVKEEQLVPKETPKEWRVVLDQDFDPFVPSVIQKTPSGYKTEVVIEDLQNLRITIHAERYRKPLIPRGKVGIPTIEEVTPGNLKNVLAQLKSARIQNRGILVEDVLQITAESEKGLRLFELPEAAKLLKNLHLAIGNEYSFRATPEERDLRNGRIRFVHFRFQPEHWLPGEFILLEPTEAGPNETRELRRVTARFFIPDEEGNLSDKLLEFSRLLNRGFSVS